MIVDRDLARAPPQRDHPLAFLPIGRRRLPALRAYNRGRPGLLLDGAGGLLELDIKQPLHQLDAVAGAAPRADPGAATILVIEPEAVLAAADGAGAVPIGQCLGRDAEPGQYSLPLAANPVSKRL